MVLCISGVLCMSGRSGDNFSIATFRATIPPIMSGIKTGGDGMRVQFDIPESDMGEAAKLLGMRGRVLTVTVSAEPIDDGRFG